MTKLFLTIFLLFNLCLIAYAVEVEGKDYSIDQIVEAIGKTENSKHYPFGIKSIDTKGNKEYARKICYNSVRNNIKRWIKASKPEDFIVFMGRRYSPPNINPNWVKLVKYFLKKGEKCKNQFIVL